MKEQIEALIQNGHVRWANGQLAFGPDLKGVCPNRLRRSIHALTPACSPDRMKNRFLLENKHAIGSLYDSPLSKDAEKQAIRQQIEEIFDHGWIYQDGQQTVYETIIRKEFPEIDLERLLDCVEATRPEPLDAEEDTFNGREIRQIQDRYPQGETP